MSEKFLRLHNRRLNYYSRGKTQCLAYESDGDQKPVTNRNWIATRVRVLATVRLSIATALINIKISICFGDGKIVACQTDFFQRKTRYAWRNAKINQTCINIHTYISWWDCHDKYDKAYVYVKDNLWVDLIHRTIFVFIKF